ncbi:hypothetical protein BRC81_06950 [Halobacteriales archaeon QS_1_68_20]|nr:MAG: hypothetical protein BRC81_06950 [Halobacteriales archaeon QS_1_68_20]
MEAALREIRDFVREEYGVRAVLATDVPIATHREAGDPDDPRTRGMSPATQSKPFSAVSNAVVFVFPYAGLTDGTSAELAAVTEFFDLSMDVPGEPLKPPERFLVLEHHRLGSATVVEHRYDCHVTYDEYEFAHEIETTVSSFLEAVFDADQHELPSAFPVHELDDQRFRATTPDERNEYDPTFLDS